MDQAWAKLHEIEALCIPDTEASVLYGSWNDSEEGVERVC